MTGTDLVVVDRREHSGEVVELRLAASTGQPLVPYVPGSHLALRAGDRSNAYSLLDDGHRPDHYRIAVRRSACASPLGGSGWLHEQARPGTVLEAAAPRSGFAPVLSARRHLLLAAGIGITPILSHLHAARRWDRPTDTVVGFAPGREVFGDEIAATATGPVTFAAGRDALTAAVDQALDRQPVGTHVFACGPAGFLEQVRTATAARAIVPQRLHLETFDAPVLDAGEPFAVSLSAHGLSLTVQAGLSLLAALDQHGLRLDRMCERGVCGRCEIGVAAGEILHRDVVLGEAERLAGDRMLACVSRGIGPLELTTDAVEVAR